MNKLLLLFITFSLQAGDLTVLTGPMKCGKTEEMIRRIRKLQLQGIHLFVGKHSIDSRSSGSLQSRAYPGAQIPAFDISDALDLIRYVNSAHGKLEYVFFDEIQFSPPDIVDAIQILLRQGLHIVVSGLDMDFKGEPFGRCMPGLLAIADKVKKMKAICEICKKENATMTQRLVDGRPARKSDPIVIVDDGTHHEIVYEPRCRQCHILLE